MVLGYLGPRGSYSYEAALFYDGNSVLYDMDNFYDVIEGVENGRLDEGILPLENSTEGVVTQVADALLKAKQSVIKREIVLPIVHNLYSATGEIAEIQYVLAHPQTLEQCRDFFRTNYPGIQLTPCGSNSMACVKAKTEGAKCGAIAGSSAGKLHGLKLIRGAVQDNSWNETRFVVIGREPASMTGNDKTSIAFTFFTDRSGCLYNVMKIFAEENINLSRIESRPAKSQLGKYFFYIDFAGHREDARIQQILDRVSEKTDFLKVLGSYPVFESAKG